MTKNLSVTEYRELNFQIKPRKYKNIKVEVDGLKFDSIKESQRYKKLLLLQQEGEVKSFELQPKFDIVINGVKCGFYKADFKVTWKSGAITIEDVKGMKTPVYNLKKRIIEALYGFKIIEK